MEENREKILNDLDARVHHGVGRKWLFRYFCFYFFSIPSAKMVNFFEKIRKIAQIKPSIKKYHSCILPYKNN